MKTFALAALLALPALGLAPQDASARGYCCGERPWRSARPFIVDRTAVIFDCDGWHCKTDIRIRPGRRVRSWCRNGWCKIVSGPFKNAWVLRRCLIRDYPYDDYDRPYRRYRSPRRYY